MAGGGTLSNPRDGTLARWTQEGNGACCGPILSRKVGPDVAQKILVRVLDLRQQAADRDRDSAHSTGSQAALRLGRVIRPNPVSRDGTGSRQTRSGTWRNSTASLMYRSPVVYHPIRHASARRWNRSTRQPPCAHRTEMLSASRHRCDD